MTPEVQSFGGLRENTIVNDGVDWAAQTIEAKSETHLEDDQGGGGSAIIRCFEFGLNPVAFHEAKPTKQDLFNWASRAIEMKLWQDGLKVMDEVNPRITVNEKKGTFSIFVGAKPQKGHILREQPQTLKQLVHGNT